MEFPKTKALIYLLTFVGYAWSGYGSGVLAHLKDAVLAAEGFFGDFLGKFTDVVGKIKQLSDTLNSSLDEECFWTCPDGVKPKKNKYHTPTSNGCGPEGLKVQTEHLPSGEMTSCCNEHDICYGTCNNDKDKCDLEFKRCLYRICDSSKMADELEKKKCQIGAKLLYTGTTTLGCKFYQESQKQACFCPQPRGGYKRTYGNEL